MEGGDFCVEIFAYCVLDNHYHILLQTPEAKLSRAMRLSMASTRSDLTVRITAMGRYFGGATKRS